MSEDTAISRIENIPMPEYYHKYYSELSTNTYANI